MRPHLPITRVKLVTKCFCQKLHIQPRSQICYYCQTCKYMGVDLLDFLRSGEKDIHAFAESQRRRRHRLPASEPETAPVDAGK